MPPKSMFLVLLAPHLLKYFQEDDLRDEDLKIYLYYVLLKNNIEILAGQLNGDCPIRKLVNLEITSIEQIHYLATECPAGELDELIIYQPLLATDQYPPINPENRGLYKSILTELENMHVAEKVIFVREDIKFDPDNVPEKAVFNNKKRVTIVT